MSETTLTGVGKLVRMANQIAAFFHSQPRDEAVEGVAGHIKDFWTAKMRREIAGHVAAGGEGLDPLAIKAIEHLAGN